MGIYPSNGTVFELPYSSGSYSTLNTLYAFKGYPDGYNVRAGVTLDSHGNLFGTTEWGGVNSAGMVYELVNSSGAYSELILASFSASVSLCTQSEPWGNVVLTPDQLSARPTEPGTSANTARAQSGNSRQSPP